MMPKSQSIQINITKPCTQAWDEMTPDGQGRHCAHCEKTVVDFTTWSDTALYNFFSKNTNRTCGRFFAEQLARPLHIPPQPNSRLYRMTVALGLTLIFTQGTDAFAQKRKKNVVSVPMWSEYVVLNSLGKAHDTSGSSGEIRGLILDEKNQPISNAKIVVSKIFFLREAYSDLNGHFSLPSLDSGAYDAMVGFSGFDTMKFINIQVFPNQTTVQNFCVNAKVSHVYIGQAKMSDKQYLEYKEERKRAKKRKDDIYGD